MPQIYTDCSDLLRRTWTRLIAQTRHQDRPLTSGDGDIEHFARIVRLAESAQAKSWALRGLAIG
jgi:hypothetical protein